MPSGVKDIQLLELKDTISQLNKTISTQNELISSLQKMLEERNAKDSEKDLLIANLQSQLAYLKNKVFGSTSEIRHDQLDGQLNLFGTPVGDEKPAEVIEPEVISVKGYTKERKPKATYDDKYNSVRSICKHFFTDIVGLSIKFFCVSLRHMSIYTGQLQSCVHRTICHAVVQEQHDSGSVYGSNFSWSGYTGSICVFTQTLCRAGSNSRNFVAAVFFPIRSLYVCNLQITQPHGAGEQQDWADTCLHRYYGGVRALEHEGIF